jgi:hypothetical protein
MKAYHRRLDRVVAALAKQHPPNSSGQQQTGHAAGPPGLAEQLEAWGRFYDDGTLPPWIREEERAEMLERKRRCAEMYDQFPGKQVEAEQADAGQADGL